MRGWLRYLCRRKMRYQIFLYHVEALREAGFVLSLDPSGAIRFFAPTGEEHCPLTAVCAMTTGKTYDLRQYQEAGRALGMKSRTIQTIADSADSPYEAYASFSAAVRRALLAGSLAGFSPPPQDAHTLATAGRVTDRSVGMRWTPRLYHGWCLIRARCLYRSGAL